MESHVLPSSAEMKINGGVSSREFGRSQVQMLHMTGTAPVVLWGDKSVQKSFEEIDLAFSLAKHRREESFHSANMTVRTWGICVRSAEKSQHGRR